MDSILGRELLGDQGDGTIRIASSVWKLSAGRGGREITEDPIRPDPPGVVAAYDTAEDREAVPHPSRDPRKCGS